MTRADAVNIAERVPRTSAEGPGTRYAIWVQGCPLRCPGCCNPELLPFRDNSWLPVHRLTQDVLETDGIDGVTFLGGEPFAQAPALAHLAEQVRQAGLGVMVFTGYTLEQLRRGGPEWALLLEQTDLLVDGPYLRQSPEPRRRWIGSANQRVHVLGERYAHLRGTWDEGRNTIELRLGGGEIRINGFPHVRLAEPR